MRETDLVIRPAGKGDLASLLELYRHLNHDDPPPQPAIAEDRMSSILAQPGMTVFMGFIDGRAAATVTLVVVPNLTRQGEPYALVENVVTHADHRRRGHAGAVLRHAIEQAWQDGCYKVMLLTGSKDPATLRFYGNCGFEQSKTGFQIRRP